MARTMSTWALARRLLPARTAFVSGCRLVHAESHADVREGVRSLCEKFPESYASSKRCRTLPTSWLHLGTAGVRNDGYRSYCCSYWKALDAARQYPTEFVKALQQAGYLATLIPSKYAFAR